MRFFNTEGPNWPEDHYSLPPLQRWSLNEILELIDQKKYFLLHAPRQTGKTSCLLALMDTLNQEGRYRAKERLIINRVTHLDQLADKLREERVRRIIEPMLAGNALAGIPEDDIQYLIDLGLCQMAPGQGLTIANPIYREVLPRALTFTPQASLPQITPWLNADGSLNPERLLAAFLEFWRQHGQAVAG